MKRVVKWLTRAVLGALGLVIILIAAGAGFVIYDGVTGGTTDELTNVTYIGPDGQQLLGYLAQPAAPGTYPGVLLIHEWWGLNEGITILADALAAEGYVVLAADAYRNRVTNMIPRALWLVMTTPTEQIFSDVEGGLDYLISLASVDAERVATMGFCFGGGHSLQLGMRRSQSLALTIIYYGALVTEPELLRPLKDAQPVLGIFGGEDATISRDDVIEFEAALNSLDIENEIMIYTGQGHGFLTHENIEQPGAARDAWLETLAFLDRNFGQ